MKNKKTIIGNAVSAPNSFYANCKMTELRELRLLVVSIVFLLGTMLSFAEERINLTQAKVELMQNPAPLLKKAAVVLKEEVEKRTGISLPDALLGEGSFTIVLGLEEEIIQKYPTAQPLFSMLSNTGKDGYKIIYDKPLNKLYVGGSDLRGVFYGMGWVLRKMEMRPQGIILPFRENISSTPVFQIRGHEWGRNNKFTKNQEEEALAQFDQYVRELAIFGISCLEMSRMILPQYVEACRSYGLDIWHVQYYKGSDYTSDVGIANELRQTEKCFKRLPHIDHWSIKSGDPGDLDVNTFMNYAEKEATLLKQYHPEAKVWIAPQRYNRAPASYFDDLLNRINNAEWVHGVVYGPWSRLTVEEFKEKTNKPIRHFPDITHNYSCQYPIRDLDLPMAMVYGRISINPAPIAKKYVHNRYANLTVGSITYSEGTNDDVNKYVWTMQDWNPQMDVDETLKDYGRFFINPDVADDFSLGLYMLEKNMEGSLLNNPSIPAALSHWKNLEASVGENAFSQIRFNMALLRAYYDAYTQKRYIYETEVEREMFCVLQNLNAQNIQDALTRAKSILAKPQREPRGLDLKQRCRELYNYVYTSTTGLWTNEFQKCVLINQIDAPLNNRMWLDAQLTDIINTTGFANQAIKLNAMINRKKPGAGGFYYNLGSLSTDSITRTHQNWLSDPYFLKSPYLAYGSKTQGFIIKPIDSGGNPAPIEWITQAGIYYDQPLNLKFNGFDKNSGYKLRLVYIGESSNYKVSVKLKANDSYVVHNSIKLGKEKYIYEFDLPKSLFSNGEIKLTWQCMTGERNVTVAELFFIKQ